MSENTTRERIANIGAGIVPTYHATESVDEAKAVVEQCTITTDELLVTGYPNSLRLELHKALKARGIGYWVAQGITFWNRDDGCECLAYGYQVNGAPRLAVKVVGFTDPEQAIATTLGAGTCRNEMPDQFAFRCSECGVGWYGIGRDPRPYPRFCPSCGRRIVEVDE